MFKRSATTGNQVPFYSRSELGSSCVIRDANYYHQQRQNHHQTCTSMCIDNYDVEDRRIISNSRNTIYKLSPLEYQQIHLTVDGMVFVKERYADNLIRIVCGDDLDEKIVDLFTSEVNVYLLARCGKLFAVSNYNTWGQTGTNHNNSQEFKETSIIHADEVRCEDGQVRFSSVHSGYGHSYFVSTNQKLYFAGNTQLGQAAQECQQPDVLVPIEIEFFAEKRVKLIASGYAFCLAVFDDNSFYGWGSNDSSQLGFSDPNKTFEIKPIPIKLPTQAEVKGLSAGQNISLVVVEGFEIYLGGQLDLQQYTTFTKLELNGFFKTPSENLLDAYIIRNKVYLLGTEHFSIFSGGLNFDKFSVSELKPSDLGLPSHSQFSYKVVPKQMDLSSDQTLFIFEVREPRHFLFKFNEKNDFCDVIIQAWDPTL